MNKYLNISYILISNYNSSVNNIIMYSPVENAATRSVQKINLEIDEAAIFNTIIYLCSSVY